MRARSVIVAMLVARVAAAAPPPRVVLADPDPELRHAIVATLVPWRIDVVVEPTPPGDDAAASHRADEAGARYVVWREGDQIVVFDRAQQRRERRGAAEGRFDAVGAAAAALTIKTMLRLPPPEEVAVVAAPPPVVARWRAEVATGGRIALGAGALVSARARGAVLVRPWAERAGWAGVAVELGPAIGVDRAGFKGDWRDAEVALALGWTVSVDDRWQLEPRAMVGLARSALVGTQMPGGAAVDDSVTAPQVGAALTARWRAGRWALGGSLDLGYLLGTATYVKKGATIFELPALTVGLGIVAAVEL